jgi:hypothetical protein
MNDDSVDWQTQLRELVKTSNHVIRNIDKALLIKQPIQEYRQNICDSCEFYIQKQDRCKKCGCIMKVKTKLYAARCPINKW